MSSRPAGTAVRLWEGDAPGAKGDAGGDVPTLTPYLPQDRTAGAAVVICPGGGYGHLAEHEGDHYARWLNVYGVAGFVLKYRLATDRYRHPAMLDDALRAVRTVRAQAARWGLNPTRIGIMGSSAGGHLAATTIVHGGVGDSRSDDPTERVSARPDVGILCYPVIAMNGPHCHAGSKQNLLGDDPQDADVAFLSPGKHVRATTPPVFLWHTLADAGVVPENSLVFAQALRRATVPFDLHIYQEGGHGLGLGTGEYDRSRWHPWTYDCIHWLQVQGFVQHQASGR